MTTDMQTSSDANPQSPPSNTNQLLEVQNLKKHFPVEGGIIQRMFRGTADFVHAVDDISFSISRNDIFCLVGESGCGKTTAARVLLGLEEPSAGIFKWKGKQTLYTELSPKKGGIKGQIIFQNPFSALNPRMRLGESVLHPLIIHDQVSDENTKEKLRKASRAELVLILGTFIAFILFLITLLNPSGILILLGTYAILLPTTFIMPLVFLILVASFAFYIYHGWIQRRKVEDQTVLKLFEEIGLTPALQYYKKFPHEVSGGERQRACIARSLILNPELLVADEPTSMLDVSLRAGILDLLKSLQETHNLSILFITHDLATARHFGDHVGVMYVGKLVECGDIDDLFKKPLHPYTRALIEAIPTPVPGTKSYDLPKGEVADAIHPPPGCRFHPRCLKADFEACNHPIHVVNEDLRITAANSAFEQWLTELGLEIHIIDRTIAEAFPFLPEKTQEEYQQVFATGESLTTEETIPEEAFISGMETSELTDIERNGRSAGKVIRTEVKKIPVIKEGKVTAVITTIRDIDRHEKEEVSLKCVIEEPKLREPRSNHSVACHYPLLDKD
ncbi:MAG: oligopeptide/dipeptide ABC transporter ATP-binding protein [Candidatus Hodarchaeota archaeon]